MRDHSQLLAWLYLFMAYGLGLLFCVLPELYQRHFRAQTENEIFQQRAMPNGYQLICSIGTEEQSLRRRDTVRFTLTVIASFSLVAVGLFKILQGSLNAPYLWLELKHTNSMVLAAFVACLVFI